MMDWDRPLQLESRQAPLKEFLLKLTISSQWKTLLTSQAMISLIFADAAVKGEDPFIFKEIHSQQAMSFSSHSVSPETVLFCAEKMFNARTKAYLLGIRGYEFGEFEERLSERAERNLEEAFEFVVDFVSSQRRKELTGR